MRIEAVNFLVALVLVCACGGAPKRPHSELAKLYEADQADRQLPADQIIWAEVGPRDEARRARVIELVAKKQLHTAADYFAAAMIFQHGSSVEDFRRAHELAKTAAELDPEHKEARWLAAAAKDRELMNLGKPQLFGTQFRKDGGGPWQLYPVDPRVTDDDRARWNCPPLAEAIKRADALNAPAPSPQP